MLTSEESVRASRSWNKARMPARWSALSILRARRSSARSAEVRLFVRRPKKVGERDKLPAIVKGGEELYMTHHQSC